LVVAVLAAAGFAIDPETGLRDLPCLWVTLFDWECFGCGLTRAGALLLRGRVHEAIAMNMLILPVAAMAVSLVARERLWRK
jgi:hypothetical protein